MKNITNLILVYAFEWWIKSHKKLKGVLRNTKIKHRGTSKANKLGAYNSFHENRFHSNIILSVKTRTP